jgi:hypothetical protein
MAAVVGGAGSAATDACYSRQDQVWWNAVQNANAGVAMNRGILRVVVVLARLAQINQVLAFY